MTRQLPLSLRWPRHQRFEHFLPGPNAAALAIIERCARFEASAWPFLAGASGSGKTHLLIAACQAATATGRRAQYLPLRQARIPLPELLDGSAGSELLALDDVQAVAGDDAAEKALFHLYNRARAEGQRLLLAANEAPAQLAIRLPDLRSRLGACTQLLLRPLSDAERRTVLRQHAAARGLQLDDAVLDWLFTHHARDLAALHALLDRMDRAALAARRRITIPFLRECLRETTIEDATHDPAG